jgi:hypothetical protein
MRSPVRVIATALAAGLLAACSFDASGGAAGGDGGPPGDDDAGPDGGPCPEAIRAQLAVNGVTSADGGEPFVTVLVGDSVELSAAGSCAMSGAVEIDWAIAGGAGIEGTAAPDLASRVVDVYPLVPGDYTVTLTVSAGAASAEPIEALAFRAVGWAVSEEALDIRDVATTTGALWVAASAGAFRLPLGNVLGAPQAVDDLAGGDDDIPNDLSATTDGPGGLVWFGHKPNDSLVWRLDVDNGRVTAIDFTPDFQASEVNDIGRGATGVVIATRDGVSAAPDNQTFEAPLIEASTFAVARGPSGVWAGGARLYRLPAATEFDLFGVEDNKIRALVEGGGAVWAGSDDQGVAVFDPASMTITAVYTAEDGLPSDKIRSIAVDVDGDVWVATDKGVGRYKMDRQAWVVMAADSGLAGATDVAALLAIGNGGTRRIIAGTKQGVAVLALP